MGAIADKLAYLRATKAELKAALTAKGAAPTDSTPFRDYAGLIRSISTAVPVILQSRRVTPTGAELTVTADSGYTGLRSVTVEGDASLIPGNIARGVSIYGVEGTFGYEFSSASVTEVRPNEIVVPVSLHGFSDTAVTEVRPNEILTPVTLNVTAGAVEEV